MAEKEAQIRALRAHGGGRRALLPALASSVASGVADCERRVAEEVRLRTLTPKTVNPRLPAAWPTASAAWTRRCA